MQRIEPGSGQESVWDYPRPPKLVACTSHIRVVFGGEEIASTRQSFRVLETSHPPTYYIPPADIRGGVLVSTDRLTICEWKGAARYFRVMVGESSAENGAWAYEQPTRAFANIAGYVALYAHLMDACYVDDERVQAQLGGFYGGG